MSRFIQLTPEDCKYLLELIEDMDSDTAYTEKQRAYTVPKLKQIAENPESRKLAFQDVDYLLELIEDDDLEETKDQKIKTQNNLEAIKHLQNSRFEESKSIENQRSARRLKRKPEDLLQNHFAQTRAY